MDIKFKFILIMVTICTFFLTASCKSTVEIAKLNQMLQWETSESSAPRYDLSKEELLLKRSIAIVAKDNDIKICYGIEVPPYFYEHTLALQYILPAPFCGVSYGIDSPKVYDRLIEKGYDKSSIFMFDEMDTLKEFTSRPKHIMLAASWTLGVNNMPTRTPLSHGVDEDEVYLHNLTLSQNGPTVQDKSMVFTKFNDITKDFSLDDIKRYYELDPNKKTILVLTSFGYSMLDKEFTPAHIYNNARAGLKELHKTYNVIVRPHPLFDQGTIDDLKKDFTIAPVGKFSSFIPFFELADVIIADMGSSASAACSVAQTPLIYNRPNQSWWGGPNRNYEETANKNRGFLISEASAVLQTEDNLNYVAAVNKAIEHSSSSIDRVTDRQRLFHYWNGCIDGYENFRIALNLLESLGANVDILWEEYSILPKYKERSLCSRNDR